MILKYLDPQTEYPAWERVLNVIATGAMKRNQLLILLSQCYQHSRVDQVLHELRQRGWLKTYYTERRGEAVYMLTPRGQRQIDEERSKLPYARIKYLIAVNDVLIRCIQQFGTSGWEWHGSPNDTATTERQMPSAMIRIETGTWWIDVDDGTRLSRQLYETCHRYTRLLREYSTPERVLFVTESEQRAMYLRRRVTGFSTSSVRFSVCNTEQVVNVLAGTVVTVA